MRQTRMQEVVAARRARRLEAAKEAVALATIIAGCTVLGLGFIYAMPYTPRERAVAALAACTTDTECCEVAGDCGEPLDFEVVTPALEVQP